MSSVGGHFYAIRTNVIVTIGNLTLSSFTSSPAGDVMVFVFFQWRSDIVSVKALHTVCTSLSLFIISLSVPHSPPLSAVPSLAPAFHLSHPPYLSLSPSFSIFLQLPSLSTPSPPPPSPPPLSLFFFFPYSLIIFPDRLHS